MTSPRPSTPNISGMTSDTRVSSIVGDRANNLSSTNPEHSNVNQQRALASNSVFDMNYPSRSRLTASQQPGIRYGYYGSTDVNSSGSGSGVSSRSTSSCNSPATNSRYFNAYRQNMVSYPELIGEELYV